MMKAVANVGGTYSSNYGASQEGGATGAAPFKAIIVEYRHESEEREAWCVHVSHSLHVWSFWGRERHRPRLFRRAVRFSAVLLQSYPGTSAPTRQHVMMTQAK